MNYPIAIEHEPGKAYGVHFPDLPGCFSARDTLDEAISNAAAGKNGESRSGFIARVALEAV